MIPKRTDLMRTMGGRDIHESHRVSTPLELLFDLFFVVAIAAAAAQLHHAVVGDHLGAGFIGFLRAFFAVWWAWMSFTWFASAYDTDDIHYRIMTMVQMAGVLIIAAGIPKSASEGDFTIPTIGYIVMRLGYVAMWIRAAREHPQRRLTALRIAFGTLALQALWIGRLFLPHSWEFASWTVLAIGEVLLPLWAARAGHLPWHAHHIAERHGLFTIIVLGECVLGATNSVAGVIDSQGLSPDVLLVGLGSVSLVLALWWVYFLIPSAEGLHEHRDRAFRWSYGHLVIFTALATLGAFLEVVADQLKTAPVAATTVSPLLAITLVATATGVYLLAIWSLNALIGRRQACGWRAWLLAASILLGIVLAVSQGLPLAWAIPMMFLAPLAIIAAIAGGRQTGGEPIGAALPPGAALPANGASAIHRQNQG